MGVYMAKDKKLSSIFSKYKTGKEDGFKTTSIDDLKKKREKIKNGYYVKGILIFFAILVLTALFKFVTGDYEVKRNVKLDSVPLEDSINVGDGEPSIEIIKDQIEGLKENQEKMQKAYEDRISRERAEYAKQIELLRDQLEEAKQNPPVVKDDSSKTEEALISLKNDFLAQITELKQKMTHINGKSQVLPPLEKTKVVKPVKHARVRVSSKEILVEEDYDISSFDGTLDGFVHKEENATGNDEIEFSILTGLSKALLITGVQAPTFGGGLKNPKPVLVSFNSDILLPNDRRLNIKECTGLGTAFGNMNTKRAEVKISKLNCIVEKEGKLYKVEEKVDASLIDGKDGVYGLKGRLVDSGAKIVMRELQVGFLQGVNQAFQTAVQPSGATTIAGIGTALPSVSQAGQVGAVTGMNSGLNALAEYYQKMMDGLYPTISVRAGREVGVLWRGGESIHLKATRIFSVDGDSNHVEHDQPFATEDDEELNYEEW
jgi:hypothetical protein